jgi:hypothetical protein
LPHHSAAWRIDRSGTPVTSAVFAGVHCLQYSATCSKPTVWSRMKSWSSQSFSIISCSTPAKSAASRPGLTGKNRSHVRAIGVMRGSCTITFAPISRACQM